MTTLYNFILHCIALCITGVFMSNQCLYDFSNVNMIILFAYIALHCCMYHWCMCAGGLEGSRWSLGLPVSGHSE